ncbi:MAG: hypothetical protein J6Z34_02130, partial [Clostridia bacterium]|nr:hypothetical protein [Clostridia bacterium]
TPVILRSGLITYDMIKSVAGKCEYAEHREGDAVKSPGVKYKHYAPHCKTAFFARENAFEAAKEYDRAAKEGLRPIIVCDDGIKELLPACRCIGLGKTSEEFASNVYYALRLAEERSDYVIGIGVEGDSQVDVGVMNRLTKACGKNE